MPGIEEYGSFLLDIYNQLREEDAVFSDGFFSVKAKKDKKEKEKEDPSKASLIGDGTAALPQKAGGKKNNLNTQQRQKLAKRRIKTVIHLYLLKRMALNYTFMF